MAYRFKNNYYISNTCECGATRKVKDHGNWVGYYCPTCKQGGSVQKHQKKHFSKHSRGWAHTLPDSMKAVKAATNGLSISEFEDMIKNPALTHEHMKHIEVEDYDTPMNLYEYCREESGGLTGQALTDYVNRYYGHN